jgi:acyl dehydratase
VIAVGIEYRRRPSALGYMALALWPKRGLPQHAEFPRFEARWRGLRASPRQRRAFAVLCGLASGEEQSMLLVHTLAFRLQMALLTQPAFPLPIWRVLQIRNRLARHRDFSPDATLDLTAEIAASRVLEKGLEVDLRCSASERGDLVWEATNTFYARGRFGAAVAPSPFAAAPAVDGSEESRWHMARGGGLRFGALTGDYNGIHLSDRYARLFGFARAFAHPQRVLGQCLAHLGGALPSGMLRLDAWLRGPVAYGAEVRLRAARRADETVFALAVPPEERPAIVGRLYCGAA